MDNTFSFSYFLTPTEQESFSNYERDIKDNSLTTMLLEHSWDRLVALIPRSVAPNVLNLAGLLCLLQAFYLCLLYMEHWPRAVTCAVILLMLAYQTLDAVSGKHARRIRNASPLGSVFQYSCSNIGVVFTSIAICMIMGITKNSSMWYVVHTAQLIALRKHVKAFKQGYIQTSMLGGEGEMLWLLILLFSLRVVFGLDWFIYFTEIGLQYTEGTNGLAVTYFILLAYTILQVYTLPFESRFGMTFCLLYRAVPAVFFATHIMSYFSILDLICDGLFMSILTTDMIVAKMAKRELHPHIVLMAMASLFSNALTLMMTFYYYAVLLTEIAMFMHLPLLSTVTNVYVDGVYDLCHLGHKNAFKKAMKFGNRLLVGVINDADATRYKRKPIMTEQERYDAVAACKFVSRVIKNAPVNGLTLDFIEAHDIHVVVYSEEYDTPEDRYYKIAREMGIARTTPRTQGMSTSELIRRIAEYAKSMDDEARQKEEAKRQFDQNFS